MKKIYILLGCILLLQLSNNLSAQVIFSEDFSTATGTTPPSGWTSTDIAGNGEVWAFDNPGGQTLNAPITDPAAIFDSDYYGSNGFAEEATLESPAFDASVITGTILLSFDHTFYDDSGSGGAGGEYFVEVWNGTAWVVALSDNNDTQDPEHTSINITSLANGAVNAKVRFRYTGNYSWYWIVDNVVLEEATCAPVTGLVSDIVTFNSADISWTAGGSETDWNIEYGVSGFTQGSGMTGTASGTAVFSAGSLTPDTFYDFYVQADCGGGDQSFWTGPITIYTGYCEFEGLGSDYFINNFSTTSGISNISNLNSGYSTNGYEDATSMVVSHFAGGPNINFYADFGLPGYIYGLGIWVDWDNNLIFDPSEQMFQSSSYEENFSGSFGVPSGTPVGNYRMRVVADYNNSTPTDACTLAFGQGEAEDYTFEVTPPPSCLPIMNLTLDGTTSNSADISWTVAGSETDWNIEYGVSGFTQGSGMTGTASVTPAFTAGSLTPNTSYDFYVQANCGGGDESMWIGPITAYTGYCEFVGTDPDYFINNFSTTGGATSNISNLNSGISAGGYQDATAMTVSQFEGGPDINFTANFGSQNWYTFGMGIWVDWNNNMVFEPSEQMFQSFGYEDNFSGSFGVPVGVAVGSYRMRVVADYYNDSPTDACTLNSGEGEAEDYTFVVVPIPSCLPVSDLNVDGETANSLDISWTPGDSETNWNIEWGVPGFVPGTGAGIDSAQQSSSASFTIGGLSSATDYDVYVQASCSSTDSSYWTLVSGTTLCAPHTVPWSENFDAMTDLDYGLVPYCWATENGEFISDDGNYTGGIANSPSNFMAIYGGSFDHLWTPEFQLIAGKKYEFSFMWAGDGNDGWAGSVVVNSTQSATGAVPLGTPFIAPADISSDDYQRAFFCFTPMTSGIYTFGVKVSSSSPYLLSFDDFNLVERANTAGTGSSVDACQINGLVDLNQHATINDSYGNWTFSGNPAAIVNDTMFNPQFVPSGIVSVDYITYGCLVDTASVLVTIYPPSTAGTDGSITACKNEPVDLYSGLGGTVNMGGDWYNPTNDLLPNSQIITGTFPGNFNYKYITGNGVCPDDSSSVVITVIGTCDWLSVDENALESVNLYPNPSTGLVYIESTLSTESFKLVITDVNGRVVETGSNSITNGINTVDLKNVQRGTYFFKLSNEHAEKVYRVVIQ
ncbi:GEVED domain-containing protein [Fluviicola chungangensis]|uniref:T9SS type A sorting domain-containing protein n=1 Tax=Fluviicola chungangensis TaxID=2597671 RepID=A0A556MGS6_9FLAO|nr:GEVED domain-containing protein [Fluviicola chungangensis]TSJ39005.1 T9SS type A sorting domain-containing protein [Fluviicola chungangensis]